MLAAAIAAASADLLPNPHELSKAGAAVIVTVWILLASAAGWMIYRHVSRQ